MREVRKGELVRQREKKVGERNLSSPPQQAPVLLYCVLKMQTGPSAFLANKGPVSKKAPQHDVTEEKGVVNALAACSRAETQRG